MRLGFHADDPKAFAAGALGAAEADWVCAPPPAGAPELLTSALRSPAWPWKTRVGENSPSLCPTIFSVQYTGMNLFPLWTAKVIPIMSGVIIERRDQVLTMRRSATADALSTFFRMCLSTNGPFFSDLAIP